MSFLRKEIQNEREDKKKELNRASNRSDEIREVRHSLGKSLQAVEEDANNLRGMLGKSLRKIDRYTEAIRRNEAPPSSTNTDESEVDDFRHREIDHTLGSPKHLRLSKRRTRSATQVNLTKRSTALGLTSVSHEPSSGVIGSMPDSTSDTQSPFRTYRRSRKSLN